MSDSSVSIPWGAWSLETGWWYHNPYLSMSKQEQHESNVKAGYSCECGKMKGRCNKLCELSQPEKKMSNEQEIEKEIQEKGLNAPRLTPDYIENTIDEVKYHIFEGTQLTVCCLVLRNGFTVTGLP